MICSDSVATEWRSACPVHGQSEGPVGELGFTRGGRQQSGEGKSPKKINYNLLSNCSLVDDITDYKISKSVSSREFLVLF